MRSAEMPKGMRGRDQWLGLTEWWVSHTLVRNPEICLVKKADSMMWSSLCLKKLHYTATGFIKVLHSKHVALTRLLCHGCGYDIPHIHSLWTLICSYCWGSASLGQDSCSLHNCRGPSVEVVNHGPVRMQCQMLVGRIRNTSGFY